MSCWFMQDGSIDRDYGDVCIGIRESESNYESARFNTVFFEYLFDSVENPDTRKESSG
jgi:hypothetical protein